MKTTTRLILTFTMLIACFACLGIADLFYSPVSGAATAAQLDDTLGSFTTAKLIRDGAIHNIITWFFIGTTFLFLWLGPLIRLFRKQKSCCAILLGAMFFGLSSCAPVKVVDYEDIKSNETVWAIPLDGSSRENQLKFNSVAFLNQQKIPMKRIMIDKVSRKIGRMYWDIEWIPTVQVIKVDRSLVTREWTSNKGGNVKQGIDVVTQDSVGLEVGLTITASIDEDDASTYLYYHGARPLSQVLDENVRSFAVAELTREYSNRNLTEAQKDGDTIYKDLFTSAAAVFKKKGVTIQYLGNQGGLEYKEAKVQSSINARYIAEQDALTAVQEQVATRTRNQTAIMVAQTEADKAKKLAEAKEAVNFQTDNQVRLLNAQANMTMAQRWTGQMPANLMPANSPLLMNMGGDGVKR